MSVLVVGAGIAGVACARALAEAGVQVEVRERSRVTGGRLGSRRLGGRPVDHGASYFTAGHPDFEAVVADWVQRKVAREWTDTFHTASPAGLEATKSGPMRYGAPGGIRSVVEDLAAGLSVVQESHVEVLEPGLSGHQAVVLAMPDPQALRLLPPDAGAAAGAGMAAGELAALRSALSGAAWKPVLALLARWPERTWDAGFDGAFVHDSPVLDWVADDGRRRGDGAPVLVAHSGSAFAADHLTDPQSAAGEMLVALSGVVGGLGEPQETYVQRWGMARPAQPHSEQFLLGPALGGLIGACGCAWGKPKVETAYLSGRRLGEALALRLG